MASTNQILGLGLVGVAGYLYLKKKGQVEESEARAASPTPLQAQILTEGQAEYSAVEPDTTPQKISMIGGSVATAVSVIPGYGQVAGAAIGAATAIAATLATVFRSAPPDPVINLLIAEMPFAWSGRGNYPPSPVYMIDRFGYRHELTGGTPSSGGFIDREVIAVNWKVFSMIPEGDPLGHRRELGENILPRPADPAVIRGILGNDARFFIGREERVRGPWDVDANVTPITSGPAFYAKLAGEYVPTHVESAGEYA